MKVFICSWSKLEPLKHEVLEKVVFYLLLNFPLDPENRESQNYKMAYVVRDLWRSSTPILQLKQFAQDSDPSSSEYL